MAENGYKDIPLGEIAPSPFNPRKSFEGRKFDELAESIRQKGVIEPIIVRPVNGKKAPYEIVAGERRFRAAAAVELQTIPALVRELADDEAYDFMLVENLQRDDLTELEEASSFKSWADRHGKDSIKELAEKIGIRPSYIRARIAVLALPPKALESWKKGELHFAHLEQLLRLPNADLQREMVDRVKSHDMSALALRKEINGHQVSLSAALFDVQKACSGCQHNSTVQQELFGLDDAKAACQHPKCFKGKQGEWLKDHWLETPQAKKYKTRGARFEDDFPRWDSKHHFYQGDQVPKKCFECENFVSLVGIEGKPDTDRGYRDENARVCIGDARCFNSAQQSVRSAEKTKDREKKKAAVDSGKQARVTWHGEYFRNVFFRKRVPEILAGLKPEDEKMKALMLMCLVHANREARFKIKKALGFRDSYGQDIEAFKKLMSLPYQKITELFRPAIEAVFLEGQNVGEWNGLGSSNRRLVAEFLGVDLSKEWAPDEEYLKKKTRKELLVFGKKARVLGDPLAKKFMAEKLKAKSDDPEKLKKSELVDVFLKSGVNLVGRVPDEILK